MTPTKRPTATARDAWTGFRANGRMHLQDAQNKLDLLDEGTNAKGIAADAVLAAIAFADAVTVQRLNQHNVADHSALPDLVQRALGRDAAKDQVTRLRRVIAEKSRAQCNMVVLHGLKPTPTITSSRFVVSVCGQSVYLPRESK